eukprot:gene9094-12264_t
MSSRILFYQPLPQEYVAVGIIGILLNTVIFILSIYSLWFKSKLWEVRYFYVSLAIVSTTELPRYFDMAIDGSYTCSVCYSFHIIASFAYFIALALVAMKFARLLELGPLISLLYSKRGLIIAIILQGIIDFITFLYCLVINNLSKFFRSSIFGVFTIFDIFQNVMYTFFLSYYGLRLLYRFQNFHQHASNKEQKQTFSAILYKVSLIWTAVLIFSLLRVALLVIKLLSNNYDISQPTFAKYGVAWFTISDFLPRSLNCIILSILMQAKNIKEANVTQNKNNNSVSEFNEADNDNESSDKDRNSMKGFELVNLKKTENNNNISSYENDEESNSMITPVVNPLSDIIGNNDN